MNREEELPIPDSMRIELLYRTIAEMRRYIKELENRPIPPEKDVSAYIFFTMVLTAMFTLITTGGGCR